MRVSIYGSCVSRDIINFDNSGAIELSSYSARSSIATLNKLNISKIISEKHYDYLENIESKFQRRMVESDFSNKIFSIIDSKNYDVLLIDLIDERFHLAEIDGKLVTRSSEFLRAGIKPNKLINNLSDHYLEIWYKGVDSFLSAVDSEVGLDVIKINKIYWADTATNPKDNLELKEKWSIDKNNKKLSKMYGYLENILPSQSIIEIPEKLFVADSDHKWGLSPFHYIDDYYKVALEKLKNLQQ